MDPIQTKNFEFLVRLKHHLQLPIYPIDTDIMNFVMQPNTKLVFEKDPDTLNTIKITFSNTIANGKMVFSIKADGKVLNKDRHPMFKFKLNKLDIYSTCQGTWNMLVALFKSYASDIGKSFETYLLEFDDFTGTKYLAAQAKTMGCYEENQDDIENYLNFRRRTDPGSWWRAVDLTDKRTGVTASYDMSGYHNACKISVNIKDIAFGIKAEATAYHHSLAKPYSRRDVNIFYREALEQYKETITKYNSFIKDIE